MLDPHDVDFDERGLVPCVVQDWGSGEVLTLAYMNALALRRTRETGELHLWSRSRDELWHKGATSGNTQAVRALRLDCDGDAVLALERTLPARAGERPAGSYTVARRDDPELAGAKVREEAEEVTRAAREES